LGEISIFDVQFASIFTLFPFPVTTRAWLGLLNFYT
jgi:hypothetical protein